MIERQKRVKCCLQPLIGLNAILKEGCEKIQTLSLVKECYAMKLDLFTKATVVDYAKTKPKSSRMSYFILTTTEQIPSMHSLKFFEHQNAVNLIEGILLTINYFYERLFVQLFFTDYFLST